MITLRKEQAVLDSDINASWVAGHRNVLAVLPTGGGKSVIVSNGVRERFMRGAIEAVLAHRVELTGQMSEHVADQGIVHRIIAPKDVVRSIVDKHRKKYNGQSFISPTARTAVGSVDTVLARADELASWAKDVNHWTIDEAHHVLKANKWGRCVNLFPNAYGLGVTASPERGDGAGLGADYDGVFHDMIVGATMRELIELDSLCDYEIVCPESDLVVDDADFAPGGDLSPKKGREASKRSHIVGDVVKQYLIHAPTKRTIVFTTDIETAGELAVNFVAHGIRAAAVSSKTPDHIREEYVDRFRDGRLTVLINVDLFGEGFDVPAVECVIMARPTASLAVYLQQFGRALRKLTGKSHGLVIDMVSNWKRHGFPDKPHKWTLARRDRRAKKVPDPNDIDLRACLECSRPFERALTACPHCGAAVPPPQTVVRTLEQVDGDLVLLDRATLAAMRAATILEAPADVAARVGMVAGDVAAMGAAKKQQERFIAQQRLSNAIAQWAAIERDKGREDRSTHKRFYLATKMSVLEALALPRQGMDEIATIVEGWFTQ